MASPASDSAGAARRRNAAAAGAQQRHATATATASPQAAGDGRHARVKKGGVMARKRALFAAVPIAAVLDNRLTPEQLRILISLLSFSDEDGRAHPSREQIALRARAHPDNVKKAIRALEKMQWITRTGAAHKGASMDYQINNLHAPAGDGIERELSTGISSSVETKLSTDLSTAQRGGDFAPPLRESRETDLSTGISSSVEAKLSTDLSTAQRGGDFAPPLEAQRGGDFAPQRGGDFAPQRGGDFAPPFRPLTDQEQTSTATLRVASRARGRAVAPAGAGVRGADAPPQNKISRFSEKAGIETGEKVNGGKAPKESKKTITLADLLGAPAPAAPAAAAPAAAAPAAAAPAAAARKAGTPASRAPASASTKNTPKKPAIRAPGERTQPLSYTPTLPTKKRAKTPKKGILAPAPSDVPSDVFTEWQALRRANRAGCGAVAVAEAREEARRAGVDFATFLKAWILSGYKGYTAETYRNGRKNEAANDDDERRIAYEREAAERRRQHEEMMSKAVSYEDFLARHPEYAAKRAAKK